MTVRLDELNTIIFDLGEVIVDLDPQAVVDEFSRLTNIEGGKVKDLIVKSPCLIEYETGRLSDEEFMEAVNALFDTRISLEEFRFAWNLMIKGVSRERLEFMSQLMNTHQVLILSNTNRLHELYFDVLVKNETGKLMKDFSHMAYYSHLIGYRKPSPDIYQFVIDQQNLSPNRTVFLDDRPENIEAAQELGIRAIQVDFPDQIFEILKNE